MHSICTLLDMKLLIPDNILSAWLVTKQWKSLCYNKQVGKSGDFNCYPERKKPAEGIARFVTAARLFLSLTFYSRKLNSFRALTRGKPITAHAINRQVGDGLVFVSQKCLLRETYNNHSIYEIYLNYSNPFINQNNQLAHQTPNQPPWGSAFASKIWQNERQISCCYDTFIRTFSFWNVSETHSL
jgi:hypothetical protein